MQNYNNFFFLFICTIFLILSYIAYRKENQPVYKRRKKGLFIILCILYILMILPILIYIFSTVI